MGCKEGNVAPGRGIQSLLLSSLSLGGLLNQANDRDVGSLSDVVKEDEHGCCTLYRMVRSVVLSRRGVALKEDSVSSMGMNAPTEF